jgi:hypothetical protein
MGIKKFGGLNKPYKTVALEDFVFFPYVIPLVQLNSCFLPWRTSASESFH